MTRIFSPTQTRLVGETAVLECNVSLVVTAAREFIFDWGLTGGGNLPMERITFTQNKQTLILTNLTIQDSQLYFCDVFAPATFDFFRINYGLNVFGEPLPINYQEQMELGLTDITVPHYCFDVSLLLHHIVRYSGTTR